MYHNYDNRFLDFANVRLRGHIIDHVKIFIILTKELKIV